MIEGINSERDCPTAISYMKDTAFAIASDDFLENQNFLQNIFLDREMFDLQLSSLGGNKHVSKNSENIELLVMKAQGGDREANLHLGYM